MVEFSIVIMAVMLLAAIADRRKTWAGMQKGMRMFLNILPTFLTVLVLIAIFLYLIPESAIRDYLGAEGGLRGIAIGSGIGSIALMPGFVAYPLAAILIKEGASVTTVAAFITTLMMVGVVTLPIEFRFMGVKASLLRNFLSLIGAVIVALLMGITYACLL